MDVTCNRCNTEYEFEEALVSSRGTTVKCTHCGHLFKVQRIASLALAADAKHWTVRRTDGHTHTLDTLSGLPQLISDGTFGRDDELSRTGKVWRRLGDIDELDEHFVAADRRGPSRVQSQRQRAEKPAPTPAPVAMPSQSPTPPAAAPSARATTPSASSPALPRRRDTGTLAAPETAAPSAKGVRHESRRHAWARLLMSAAIVAAIAFWFFSLPPSGEHKMSAQPEAPADPSLRFLAAAERALAAYQIDQFDQALVEYGKALGYHEGDAHILSGISHVHALWAEELRSQRELSKHAPGQTKPAVDTLESEAHAQRAKHYAELALQGDPGNSEAKLVMSDALRLAGDLRAARSALTDVPASAELYRVSALLALREAEGGDTHRATELAAQAVAADPTRLSTRFLLARLLWLQAEPDTARAQIAAIRAAAPLHPELQQLESLLALQAPNATAEAEARPAANNSEADSLIERGRGQLEAGQLTAAKRSFEHALSLQPGSVAAHAGLGQAAIARGRHLQALDHLVAAALGGDSESLIALAETYRRLGRQREALTAYQSYVQQNPNGPQLDLAKSQIERLGEQFASARKP